MDGQDPTVVMCVECEDQEATVKCQSCVDYYCDPCYEDQHRKGQRAKHVQRPIHQNSPKQSPTQVVASFDWSLSDQRAKEQRSDVQSTGDAKENLEDKQGATLTSSAGSNDVSKPDFDVPLLDPEVQRWFVESTKYVPLRLTEEERVLLNMLEAALEVSEYTDRVDVLRFSSKFHIVREELAEIFSIISGLVMACDFQAGKKLLAKKTLASNKDYFRKIFEVGRRYKVMNPEKMRTTYGKLIHMLQDAQSREIQESLGFSLVVPLPTVYSLLEENRALGLLEDPYVAFAIGEAGEPSMSAEELEECRSRKQKAIDYLCKKYARPSHERQGTDGASNGDGGMHPQGDAQEDNDNNTTTSTTNTTNDDNEGEEAPAHSVSRNNLTADDVRRVLLSIGDFDSYLCSNRGAIDDMAQHLEDFFHITRSGNSRALSLEITAGRDGARLSHSHDRQYRYVHQTFSLWRAITTEMFKLWFMAEKDMLSGQMGYRLRDTGQGLNRVQPAPSVEAVMYSILRNLQRKTDGWVGSSVVHLGDHNVPNAMIFIDKYTQISRILHPILSVWDQLERLDRKREELRKSKVQAVGGKESDASTDQEEDYDLQLAKYLDNWGGPMPIAQFVLADFFKHGFDGSGANNFYDAGSCIDGRLTSAWNWCSRLQKKEYYQIFQLFGFVGFDGDFS